MTRPIMAHYIRENKNANVPRRMVVFNCVAREDKQGDSTIHTWRAGVAIFTHWTRAGIRHVSEESYETPEQMWAAIGDFTRPKSRTVAYAHNLPYQLRVSRCLGVLPAINFRMEAIRVSDSGSWSRWSRDSATLAVCDDSSVFPVTVRTLGLRTGRPLAVPPEVGDEIGQLSYALDQARIVAGTMADYFEWLRTGVAGNWQMTGAGQSWAHWRHAHYTHKVLVHQDDEALKAERRAMWTGRAENWRWGRDYDAPIYEWDFESAYPRIARDCEIPVRLTSVLQRPSTADIRACLDRFRVLATGVASTGVPVVPTRHNDRVLWPVGQFETTLWDPEIRLLLDTGGTFTPSRVWLYQKAPALRSWGSWVLGSGAGVEAAGRPWLPLATKHWSRALIGRFATQYQRWEPFGDVPDPDVRAGTMIHRESGTETEFMQIGREIHEMVGLAESDDSCPQITGWIMSEARRRLWDAILAAGTDHVLYMDTDSVIVDTQGDANLRQLANGGQIDGLRLKHRHRGYEIYGPRAAVLGTDRVFSGIPRNSVRTGDVSFTGEVWTQMERAIRIGEHDRVTVRPRKFTTKWNEHRRIRASDGRTVAISLPDGQPVEPIGTIAAVLESEKAAIVRSQLNGRNAPDQERVPALDANAAAWISA